MTALCVGDLSRQGKPPEERETVRALAEQPAGTTFLSAGGDLWPCQVFADSFSKHGATAALTWVKFCLGSGESGTEPPGRVSEAAQTAR